jgi:hypothetical protein
MPPCHSRPTPTTLGRHGSLTIRFIDAEIAVRRGRGAILGTVSFFPDARFQLDHPKRYQNVRSTLRAAVDLVRAGVRTGVTGLGRAAAFDWTAVDLSLASDWLDNTAARPVCTAGSRNYRLQSLPGSWRAWGISVASIARAARIRSGGRGCPCEIKRLRPSSDLSRALYPAPLTAWLQRQPQPSKDKIPGDHTRSHAESALPSTPNLYRAEPEQP